MIKHKLFGALVAIISFASPLLAITDNPDPNYIIVDGGTIHLLPHGFETAIPSQDTRNFKWIFDNYPHSNIHLSKGTYHVSETIEAVGYQGTIKGKGQKKTFIIGRGPLVGGQYEFPLLNADLTARFYPSSTPWLFWFHPADGDVNDWHNNKVSLKLKDFTVSLDGVGPLVTLLGQPLRAVWGCFAVTGHKAAFTVPVGNVSHVKFKTSRVTFKAETVTYDLFGNPKTNANLATGFLVYGGEHWEPGIQLNGFDEIDHSPLNAQVNVKNCLFKDLFQYACGVEGGFTRNTGTAYTFPTDPPFPQAWFNLKDNVFDHLGDGAEIIGGAGYSTLVLGASDFSVNHENNTFKNIPAIGFAGINGYAESMPKNPSFFSFQNNTFHHLTLPTSNSGIFLLDLMYPTGGYYSLNIQKNEFSSEPGFFVPFINIVMGTNGKIKKNLFTGDAFAAIMIGATPSPFPPFTVLPASLYKVSNNNFTGLNAIFSKVFLGTESYFNTVKVKRATDVIDAGVDNVVIVD